MSLTSIPGGSGRESSKRNSALDGLRGIAIALVLWLHLAHPYLPPGRASWLGWLRAGTDITWIGVDLFFALSGFFIGGILLDHRKSRKLTQVFYLRRALRILPLYYLTLAAMAVMVLFHAPGSYHIFPTWVYGAFLTNVWVAFANSWDWLPLSALWSLAVEEQFYLAAPWVMRGISERGIPLLLGTLALSAEAMRICFMWRFPDRLLAVHVLTPLRMDSLAFGVMVAWAVRSPRAEPYLLRFGVHWRLWLGLCAAMLGGLDLLQIPIGARDLVIFGYLIISMSAAMVVLVVARIRPKRLCRFLEWRPLVHLGRHAYFIYLWHGILGQSLILYLGGPQFALSSLAGVALVGSAIVITWGAAAVSWRWFEGPIVAWGQKHAY